MAHYEPSHQDLHCLEIQLFSSLVLKELSFVSAPYLLHVLHFLEIRLIKMIHRTFVYAILKVKVTLDVEFLKVTFCVHSVSLKSFRNSSLTLVQM